MAWRRAAWVLILVALLGSGQPSGAQDGADAQRMVTVGSVGGAARAVASLSNGVLLAEGAALLRLDAAGQTVGQLGLTQGEIQDIALQGEMAYVLTESGLAVVDTVALTVRDFTPGGGQAVVVTAQAVYVAARQAGLRAAILRGDGLPGMWQVVDTPGAAVALAVEGAESTLYVAQGERGVGVYTLSAPLEPTPVGWLDDIGTVETVTVEADRLLVGSGHRLRVFDLADPAVPRLLATYDPLHDARDVLLRQGWAYIADAAGGLKRYRIGDLESPRLDAVVWPGTAYALADDGRYLYVAGGWNGVIALDAGRLDTLTLSGRAVVPGEVTAVAVAGQGENRWGLAGMGADGVAVIDWRDVDFPRLRAVVPFDGVVRAVALRGRIGYAAVEGTGLVIFSVTSLESPRLLATMPLEGTPQSLAVADTLLYAAAGDGGLYILETIRPADPVVLGRLLPPRADQPLRHVSLEGGKRAYLSTGEALLIADVDVPGDPQILATVRIPAAAAVARNFIAYAVGGPALTTVNAASSNEPEILGSYRAADTIRDAVGQGETLWLAGQGSGAAAVGLQLSPDGTLVERFTAGSGGGWALDRIDSGSAWLAAGSGALWRLDSVGASLVRPAVPGGRRLRPVGSGQVLIGGEDWGLLDLSQPENPRVIAAGEGPGMVQGLAAADALIALAVGDEGVYLAGAGEGRWLPGAADGAARDVATDGRFLFVAEDGPGARGALRVLATDVLDTVTMVSLPGGARAVTLWDDRAVVAYARDEGGGVAVVDVQAPTGGLTLVGTADIPASGLTLSADGRLGYAVRGDVLRVFDPAGWPHVQTLRTVTLPQPVTRLLPGGSRWLLGLTPGESLLLLDLVDPAVPLPAAALLTTARDAAATDDVLVLASETDGLQMVSLSTRVDLQDRMTVIDPAPVAALWLDGVTLYAAGGGALRVYDLGDPDVPPLAAALDLSDIGEVRGIAGRVTRRDGRWLYIATEAGLLAVHHAPDGTLVGPVVLDDEPIAAVYAASAQHLYIRGETSSLGVITLDASDAADWMLTYPLPGGAPRAVLAWDDRVVVGMNSGLALLEWAAEAVRPPAVIGQITDLPGEPLAVQDTEDGMIWAAGGSALWQIDARNPAHPTLAQTLTLPAPVTGIALSSDDLRLAVAAGRCGLRLWDVSAAPPREIGYWRSDGLLTDVAAVGDLFVAVGEEGVILLRAQPDQPPVMPAVPFEPSPANQAVAVGAAAELQWSPAPDACDGLHYTVSVGIGEEALITAAEVDSPSVTLHDLPSDVVVRWQVQVTDAQGDAISGPVWRFYTGSPPERVPLPGNAAGERLSSHPAPVTTPGPEGISLESGVDAGVLVPLLIIGALLEVGILRVLWHWWRWQQARR